MPRGYYRNVDDGYSDPELIATQYQVGRNAYFEVQLTLAEFADSIQSGTGGLQGSPDVAQALAGAGVSGGCPRVDQYVWVDDYQAVKAKTLIGQEGKIRLYNPITRNFNVLKSAEILKSQPICGITTQKGFSSIVSHSHQVIRNVSDMTGINLTRCKTGQEVLGFDEGIVSKSKNWNVYADTLIWFQDLGFGDVVCIELETEWIYASGITKKAGIVAHNRKEPTIVE